MMEMPPKKLLKYGKIRSYKLKKDIKITIFFQFKKLKKIMGWFLLKNISNKMLTLIKSFRRKNIIQNSLCILANILIFY